MPEPRPRFPVLLHPDLYRRLRESDRSARAGVWKALRLLREGRWGGGTRVKRLRGVARPVYEARTDSGDRLLFTLARSPLEDDPGRMAAHLQVWDWLKHDDVDRAARRNRFPEAEFLELEAVEQFDIDEPPPHPEATFAEVIEDTQPVEPLLQFLFPPEGLEAASDEELGIRWYRLDVAGDEELQRLLDEGGEELELKLSREQYEVLNSPGPVLLAGSAGSGKTTVSVHRLAAAPSTALYLSYSPALVEHARKLYRDLAAARGAEVRPANFFTFGELYRFFAKEQETPEMTEALFHEWFRKAGRSLDPALVWEELRSVLKGACLDLDKPMLDEATYFELGKKRAPLFVDLRPEIYRVAQRYQQWLAAEGRSDRIDLCRRAFAALRKSRGRNWDVVVCDEVQDLTELEVAFVLALSRRPDLSGVLLTGDTQQIIQPSGFRWAEVRRLVGKARGRRDVPEVMRLRRNLRAVRPLVELANALLLLRREVFGRTEEDEPEDAALDGPVPIEVAAGEEAVLAAIEGFGPRCAVLAAEEEAGRLRARLGTSRVFPVREAKGLEFDVVVLWKLLGPDRDLAERFVRGATGPGGLEREPRFQRLLQHLYVAVTRARRHLAIYEGQREGPEPHPFWGDARFRGRLDRETVENLARIFRSTASPAEWESEGEYFLERGYFRQAAECFRRAGRPEREDEALALADEEREDWDGALARWTGLRRPDHQAPLLARLGRLAEAAALWREAGREDEARLCDVRLLEARKSWKEAAAAWEELGRHADAARAWEQAGMRRNAAGASARAAEEAGEPGRAGELWLEAGDFAAAARGFRAAGEPRQAALALARRHEETGEWSRAAAAWRLGGDRRNAERCRAEALERSDRPGPAAVYWERLGETGRALDLYVRAGRWLDAARLEPPRPADRRQVLEKIRKLGEGAEELLAIRRETLQGLLPNVPGVLLLGPERLAWQELLELERLEHRPMAERAEAAVRRTVQRKGRAAWQPPPAPASRTAEPEGHSYPELLRRLLAEEASPSEIRVLVRHGLRGCPGCAREMEPMLRPPVPPLDGYDAALDRIHGKIARDELKGLGSFFPPLKSLHAEIFENTFVQMLLTMHSTRRIAELSLCDVLLRQQRTAGLALQVAETFHQSLYGTPVVQDPHAWSWDAPESPKHERGEDALAAGIADKVRQLLAWGPDPSERAALLTLQATVEGARRRAGEAVRLLNRAAAIHRRQGDRHLFGRVLLQKGILLGSAGRHAMALRLLRRSLDLVDPAREPRLVVEGVHHLIWFLSRTGQTPEAEACLHAARRLYERANDRRHLGRLHWLEGRIAARPREAESALIAARDALNREGLGHEAALASLDLGALYVRERREVDVRRQPETVFSLASSGNLLKDSTLLIETAGALTREEPAAPLVENLESWTKDLREKNNPPGLIPRL